MFGHLFQIWQGLAGHRHKVRYWLERTCKINNPTLNFIIDWARKQNVQEQVDFKGPQLTFIRAKHWKFQFHIWTQIILSEEVHFWAIWNSIELPYLRKQSHITLLKKAL